VVSSPRLTALGQVLPYCVWGNPVALWRTGHLFPSLGALSWILQTGKPGFQDQLSLDRAANGRAGDEWDEGVHTTTEPHIPHAPSTTEFPPFTRKESFVLCCGEYFVMFVLLPAVPPSVLEQVQSKLAKTAPILPHGYSQK
jgi:hypothetical protein